MVFCGAIGGPANCIFSLLTAGTVCMRNVSGAVAPGAVLEVRPAVTAGAGPTLKS